jgi:transcriptional regulator with XRE-family HTH domain
MLRYSPQTVCSDLRYAFAMAVNLKNWLKKALDHSGMGQAELARELGYGDDRSKVNKMVAGTRTIHGDELLKIAKITGYPAPTEAGKSRPRKTNAIGYIGAGAEVVPYDDHAIGAGLEEVEIPPGVPDDAVLVIVRGDSMYPRYKDGEMLFYIKQERDPRDLIGLECVVKLEDGRMYVKDLERGANGRFNLISHNAPPLLDQVIEWAAPVLARVNKGVGR